MVYTGTIATENDIALMAGENVDATGNTEANHNLLIAQAEAFLCCFIQYDIVTNWGSLSSIYRAILTEWAARYCALSLVHYNMSGYSTIVEAEDLISIHSFRMDAILDILSKSEVKNFLGVN